MVDYLTRTTAGGSEQLLSRQNEAIDRATSTKDVLACCVALWQLLTCEYISQRTDGLIMACRFMDFIEDALSCCCTVVTAWEGVRREKASQAAVRAADEVMQAWNGVRWAALHGFRSFCERLSSGLVRKSKYCPLS
jgi:hypothetical protein